MTNINSYLAYNASIVEKIVFTWSHTNLVEFLLQLMIVGTWVHIMKCKPIYLNNVGSNPITHFGPKLWTKAYKLWYFMFLGQPCKDLVITFIGLNREMKLYIGVKFG
jgi:hypothetical protein